MLYNNRLLIQIVPTCNIIRNVYLVSALVSRHMASKTLGISKVIRVFLFGDEMTEG